MANVMRWRYGEHKCTVFLWVPEEVRVEIGDLLYRFEGMAMPASSLVLRQGGVCLQSQFADSFLGVAMQVSKPGLISEVRTATTGVFEYECNSTILEPGDLIGPCTCHSKCLENQKVTRVTDIAQAIGRCAKTYHQATTRVAVDIVSTIYQGGLIRKQEPS